MDITKKVTKITYNGVNLPIDGITPTPEPQDPVQVYKSQRNPEWLNMLGTGYGENYDEMESYYDTADNEIRLLFHLAPPADNLIAFNVTTSSGQYNVSYYDKNDNLISVDVNSNTKFEANLMYDDFKHEMSDGTRQVLIVIKPTTIGSNLRTFRPDKSSLKTTPTDYMVWTVVEMMGKTTGGTSITPTGSNYTYGRFRNIVFYTLFGTNSITNMRDMFPYCISLKAIPQLDTSSATSMWNMFSGCTSLISIPQLDTSSVTDMYSMFKDCYSLTAIPELDTSLVTNMYYMFENCYSLTEIPKLDTGSVTNMAIMFSGCYSLRSIPQLDTSSAESIWYMFQDCYSLTEIPELDLSSATDITGIFAGCRSLTAIPELDTSLVTNMGEMFRGCTSLTVAPQLDTSSAEGMDSMFGGCSALTAIPEIDISSVMGGMGMFNGCNSLKTLTITGTLSEGTFVQLGIANCSFGYQALLNLLGSLPVVTSMGMLEAGNNIGTAQLSAEVQAGTPPAEYAQAVGRGWTIVL